MKDDKFKETAENLFVLFQSFYKKVINPEQDQLHADMCRSHYEAMFIIYHNQTIPTTEIAKQLKLSKPYMTSLLNKLVSEEYAIRIPDQKDRRVINIQLTEKGKDFLKEHYVFMINDIKSKISTLSEKRLNDLNTSSRMMLEIISQLNMEERK
ncbi:MarR family transcriptional regulator [Petroclostridium sp. X23]|uniref:MarR family winged helix-turn-helix transcriptional regulator n=1 Tax=Petroclostridium sp. X23 TaxID=3045146 RepID=UPI0024AD2360|nr:MarR family transcriptional regulator [Petroclostridium sp. X23]WHH59405.1 MarR family transcriptional regulator [Petroclostridium sp. X23]